MTLVDTGSLVALFDSVDRAHGRCVETLKTVYGRTPAVSAASEELV